MVDLVYAYDERGRLILTSRTRAILKGYKEVRIKDGREEVVADYSKLAPYARKLKLKVMKEAGGNIKGGPDAIEIKFKPEEKTLVAEYETKPVRRYYIEKGGYKIPVSEGVYRMLKEREQRRTANITNVTQVPERVTNTTATTKPSRPNLLEKAEFAAFKTAQTVANPGVIPLSAIMTAAGPEFSKASVKSVTQTERSIMGAIAGPEPKKGDIIGEVIYGAKTFAGGIITTPLSFMRMTLGATTESAYRTWKTETLKDVAATGTYITTHPASAATTFGLGILSGKILKTPVRGRGPVAGRAAKPEVEVGISESVAARTGPKTRTVSEVDLVGPLGKGKVFVKSESKIVKTMSDVSEFVKNFKVKGVSIRVLKDTFHEKILGKRPGQTVYRKTEYFDIGRSRGTIVKEGDITKTIEKGVTSRGEEFLSVAYSQKIADVEIPTVFGREGLGIKVPKHEIYFGGGVTKSKGGVTAVRGRTYIFELPEKPTYGRIKTRGLRTKKTTKTSTVHEIFPTEMLEKIKRDISPSPPKQKNLLEVEKTVLSGTLLKAPVTQAHFSRVGTIRQKTKKKVVNIEDLLRAELTGTLTLTRQRVKLIPGTSSRKKVRDITAVEKQIAKTLTEGTSSLEKTALTLSLSKTTQTSQKHRERLKPLLSLKTGTKVITETAIKKPKKPEKVVNIPRKKVGEKLVGKVKKKKRKKKKKYYTEKIHQLADIGKIIFGGGLSRSRSSRKKSRR